MPQTNEFCTFIPTWTLSLFLKTTQSGNQMAFLSGLSRKRQQESRSQALKGGSFWKPGSQGGFLGPRRQETGQPPGDSNGKGKKQDQEIRISKEMLAEQALPI